MHYFLPRKCGDKAFTPQAPLSCIGNRERRRDGADIIVQHPRRLVPIPTTQHPPQLVAAVSANMKPVVSAMQAWQWYAILYSHAISPNRLRDRLCQKTRKLSARGLQGS